MSDKGRIDRAKLIVYVQIALNASVKILELYLKRWWSATAVHG
jgi:hypothetical protein